MAVWLALTMVTTIATPAVSQTIFGFEDIILGAEANVGNASLDGLVQDTQDNVTELRDNGPQALVGGDWSAGAEAGVYIIVLDGTNGAAAGVFCEGGDLASGQAPACSPSIDVTIAKCYWTGGNQKLCLF